MTDGPNPSESPVPAQPLPPLPASLTYAPVSRQKLGGREIRLIILLCAALLGFTALLFNPFTIQKDVFGYGILGTPFGFVWPFDWQEELVSLAVTFGFLAVFLLSEWLFLLPRGRLSLRFGTQRRSRLQAAIGGAFIAMLLTIGLTATIMELSNVWDNWLGAEITFRGITWKGIYSFWIAMTVAWAVWAVIFYVYYRDADHHTAVARMTRVLLGGTVLELLISIPTYVRALPAQDECRCGKGSYTGLAFGCTAAFWLFGPGVYLLFLRERRRWTPKV